VHRIAGRAFSLSGGILAVAFLASWASAEEPAKKFTEKIKNKQGKEVAFDLVLVPGGKFTMGSPDGEKGRKPHEGPQFQAEIKPFYLCAHETTWEMFMAYYDETVQEKRGDPAKEAPKKKAEEAEKKGVDAISGPTPLYGDPTLGWGAGKRPAIGVSHLNAETFCKWLSKKTGKKYRLPTEAEWEYACRAGAVGPIAGTGRLDDMGWYEANSAETTHPVGSKRPNAWGLHDMHGNVSEWCRDTYVAAYPQKEVADPAGPAEDSYKVIRGGSWGHFPPSCRSAARNSAPPAYRFRETGFRVVLEVTQ